MAIAFDVSNEATSTSASSLTYALTITDNGGDECIVVSTNSRDNFTGTQTVTYDGVSLTEAASTDQARLFYLASPTTGSSANVVANFDGTGACSSTAQAYNGVDTADLVGATASDTGSGTNATLDITTDTDGSWVVGTMSLGGTSDDIVAGDDQTLRESGTPGQNHTYGSSDESVPTATTQTHDYTHSSQGWGISAIEIHEAAAVTFKPKIMMY